MTSGPPSSLKNCRKALSKGGRLLLVESVIPAGNEPSFGKLLDLNMLVMPGGASELNQSIASYCTPPVSNSAQNCAHRRRCGCDRMPHRLAAAMARRLHAASSSWLSIWIANRAFSRPPMRSTNSSTARRRSYPASSRASRISSGVRSCDPNRIAVAHPSILPCLKVPSMLVELAGEPSGVSHSLVEQAAYDFRIGYDRIRNGAQLCGTPAGIRRWQRCNRTHRQIPHASD